MSESREYRIVVRGGLSQRLAGAFDGFALDAAGGCTEMRGEADQAQLHGVLTRIRDLGIELVSVNPVEPACR